jgi:hypothetical protein
MLYLATATVVAEEPDAFWRAVRTLEFGDPAVREVQGEQKEFALGLQRVVQGEEGSEDSLIRTCDALTDPGVRRKARPLCASLLAGRGRWAELEKRQRDSDGRVAVQVREFSKLPPATLGFPDGPVALPTKLDLHGSPLVEVAVNGHKHWFVLDTGAMWTTLAADVAKASGVAPLGVDEMGMRTANSRTLASRPAVIDELALGEIRFRNHPAMVAKNDMRFKAFGLFTAFKIDGILGWNALSQLEIEIDYAQPRVVLRRPARRAVADRNLFSVGLSPAVRGSRADGARFLFTLDTGARDSWALPELLRKTRAAVESEGTRRVGGAGGSEEGKVRKIAPLEVRVSECSVELSEAHEDPGTSPLLVDGYVGVDLAHRGWMRIDDTNGVFECRRQPPEAGPPASTQGS